MLTSTKQDILDNKAKVIPLLVVLKALTHGVKVVLDKVEYEMQNGRIYVAMRTYEKDKSWEESKKHYIGTADMPLQLLVNMIENEVKSNPKFLEELQVQIAAIIELNKLG